MKVINEENQEFTDYVLSLNDAEVIYDSDYDNPTFDPGSTESAPICNTEPAAVCNLNDCNLDDGEFACGDDFADNGDVIQGGPCQDLREYAELVRYFKYYSIFSHPRKHKLFKHEKGPSILEPYGGLVLLSRKTLLNLNLLLLASYPNPRN